MFFYSTEITIRPLLSNSDDDFAPVQTPRKGSHSFSYVKAVYFNHLRRLGVPDELIENDIM